MKIVIVIETVGKWQTVVYGLSHPDDDRTNG